MRRSRGTQAADGILYCHVLPDSSAPVPGSNSTLSVVIMPSPQTYAPSICPTSTAGLRLRPLSYCKSTRSTLISPVRPSTSTSATAALQELYLWVIMFRWEWTSASMWHLAAAKPQTVRQDASTSDSGASGATATLGGGGPNGPPGAPSTAAKRSTISWHASCTTRQTISDVVDAPVMPRLLMALELVLAMRTRWSGRRGAACPWPSPSSARPSTPAATCAALTCRPCPISTPSTVSSTLPSAMTCTRPVRGKCMHGKCAGTSDSARLRQRWPLLNDATAARRAGRSALGCTRCHTSCRMLVLVGAPGPAGFCPSSASGIGSSICCLRAMES
mmetsp:Transcript_4164/g.10548  ORF Transcript_4164/g.10548 Transcript_4164/m.10548 type:complete len:332 (+) Transcript_4164:462-1457(+)